MSSRSGRAVRGRRLDVEVAGLLRDRNDPVVVDPQHLQRRQVDEHDQPVDRVRPLAVAGPRAKEGQAAGEPTILLLGRAEVPGRPGVDLDGLEVGHAALRERLLKARVALHQLLCLGELLDHRERLHALEVAPLHDGRVRDGNEHLVGCGIRPVEQDNVGEALEFGAGIAAVDALRARLERLLIGRPHLERDEPDAARQRGVFGGAEDGLADARDLGRGQRIERVGGRHLGAAGVDECL